VSAVVILSAARCVDLCFYECQGEVRELGNTAKTRGECESNEGHSSSRRGTTGGGCKARFNAETAAGGGYTVVVVYPGGRIGLQACARGGV